MYKTPLTLFVSLLPRKGHDDLPEVWDIVELSDDGVEQFWSDESVLDLDLRRKMSENHNGWLVRSDQ